LIRKARYCNRLTRILTAGFESSQERNYRGNKAKMESIDECSSKERRYTILQNQEPIPLREFTKFFAKEINGNGKRN